MSNGNDTESGPAPHIPPLTIALCPTTHFSCLKPGLAAFDLFLATKGRERERESLVPRQYGAILYFWL